MFRHPKYYKELRKRNRDLSKLQQVKLERSVPQLDQVISDGTATAPTKRAPDPGPKQQAPSEPEPGSGSTSLKHQATSIKPQTTSVKPQATSYKLPDPRTTVQEN
jgi:hypothetical protein